ncbi:MAG TPA: sulfite exporter TauE/SafE family protein [candidate division Zixibacteria bacterium]|nr:sulfite exporter TauE/SafE family protein [candidate division Zixibacteria bacterium]
MDRFLEFLVRGTDLSFGGFFLLCGVSFLGSLIAGALGLGGGVLVLATMANLLSPAVLIPIHGVVQLASNLSRAVLSWRQTLISIVAPFFVGSMIGAALGAHLVVSLPKYLLQIVIALFILASTWAPALQSTSTGRVKFFLVGIVTTLVTMFVGGTGVLVGAFVAPACRERHQFVSTHAVVMTIQHGLKIGAFALLGFAFGPYVPLLAGLVLFSFLGSYAGKLALNRLPEQLFRAALKATLTVLSLQLLYTAAIQLAAR